MVSPSNSAVAIDGPKGLGNQVWQRVQGVPLVARPSSPWWIRDNSHRFAGNLANEVFSRYLGGSEGAYYPGNKLPLHLHVMRKVCSGWHAPLEIAAGPATKIRHQNLAKPSVATVSLPRNPHNPLPFKRPFRLFNALHRSAVSAAGHENPGARPLSSPALREAVEPVYERLQHGDSDMRLPIVYRAERIESAEAVDLTRPADKPTVGNIRSIVSKATLVTKRALGQHRQFTPLSSPPGLRLHRMRRSKAAERESSAVDRFSTGSSEQLSLSFHADRSLAVSQSGRTGLASVSGRYPLSANQTAVSGVRNHPAAASIERSTGISSIPVNVQGLRSEASATSSDSCGAVSPIHRSITPSRIRYRRSAEAILADSGTLPTPSYLPFQAKMTMGSGASANLITQHSLRAREVIGRETPATGGGLAMMPESPVHATPFVTLTPPIRRQPMVMSMRRLGHRPFEPLHMAVSVSNSDSSTRAGTGEVRRPFAVSVARMTPTSAEGSPSPPRLVSQPVAARHAGAASTSSSRRDIVSLAADSNGGTHGGEARNRANARQGSSPVPQPTLQNQIKVTAGSLGRNFEAASNRTNLLMHQAVFTPSARNGMPFASAKRSVQQQPVLQSSMHGQALATFASYGAQTAMTLPRAGASSSQGRLGILQRLQPTQSTVSDISSLHKPASMTTQRSFSLGQRGIAANSATLNKCSAAADMNGFLQRSSSSPRIDSEMPLASKKVIARMLAHSEQGVSGLQQLGSPAQLQAAAVSSEGGGERAINTQTQTAVGQTEEATPPQTDLEALADKLWQKIQRKLTVERERRGLASWPV